MKNLSKQDRAVARTAPDVERRYRLNKIEPLQQDVDELKQDIVVDSKLSASSEHPVENRVITTELAKKVTKEENKGLSTNDFTNEYKSKLDGVEKNAQVNAIEKIKVNGTEQTITNKTVNISVSSGGGIDVSDIWGIIYPIGTYYETSDATFNPNTAWGGTWVLEEDGTVLVSKSNDPNSKFNTNVGTIIGEEEHQLTKEELPRIDIQTNFANPSTNGGNGGGLQYGEYAGATVNVLSYNVNYGDKPHNNIQPSKIVNRWHRTA